MKLFDAFGILNNFTYEQYTSNFITNQDFDINNSSAKIIKVINSIITNIVQNLSSKLTIELKLNKTSDGEISLVTKCLDDNGIAPPGYSN